jgi:predicted nucleotidyltransferase
MVSKKEWEELNEDDRILRKALEIFRVEAKDLPRVVERFQREIKEMEEKLKMFDKTNVSKEKSKIFEDIVNYLKEKGAKKVAVFGSYARGEEKTESDIDIVVEFSEKKSLLELVKIERELSEILGIKVDLLTEKFISPYIIDDIKKEMKVIYS